MTVWLPRVFAAERTVRAWIQTGLVSMGLGFVLEADAVIDHFLSSVAGYVFMQTAAIALAIILIYRSSRRQP